MQAIGVFAAEVTGAEVRLAPAEHSEHGRFPIEPCLERVHYRGLKDGLRSVHEKAFIEMIRKLPSGQYRLYSRKSDPKTRKRRNLGTFRTRAAAEELERAVQYFKGR